MIFTFSIDFTINTKDLKLPVLQQVFYHCASSGAAISPVGAQIASLLGAVKLAGRLEFCGPPDLMVLGDLGVEAELLVEELGAENQMVTNHLIFSFLAAFFQRMLKYVLMLIDGAGSLTTY